MHVVLKNLDIATSKLDEIRAATACDNTMQTIIRYCHLNGPDPNAMFPLIVGNLGTLGTHLLFMTVLCSLMIELLFQHNYDLKCSI